MAFSRVVLWNNATSIFGGDSSGIIEEVTDEGDVAKWLRMFDQEACDYCVSLFDWQDAMAFSQVAAAVGTIARADWEYAYAKPANMLRIIDFTDEDGRLLQSPYELMGGYILCDQTPGYIKYIRQMVLTSGGDLLLMSPALRDLIAKRLAVMISPVYMPAMKGTAIAEFEMSLNEARAVNQDNVYKAKTGWIYDIG